MLKSTRRLCNLKTKNRGCYNLNISYITIYISVALVKRILDKKVELCLNFSKRNYYIAMISKLYLIQKKLKYLEINKVLISFSSLVDFLQHIPICFLFDIMPEIMWTCVLSWAIYSEYCVRIWQIQWNDVFTVKALHIFQLLYIHIYECFISKHIRTLILALIKAYLHLPYISWAVWIVLVNV